MSLRGIEVFKEYFKDHTDEYVLIGGAACDLLFDESGGDFRATKDLDLVLLVEALSRDFGHTFWRFIEDGQYENRAKSSGEPQFYRFSNPQDAAFPLMIELFSRTGATLRNHESQLTPIHIDDEVSSLSAILLDEDYYRLLNSCKLLIDGTSVLSVEGLIPFKAKAWLDLKQRKSDGHPVDEKSIRKHKNDVCRLATLLTGNERPELSVGILEDMRLFMDSYIIDPVDPKSLRISGISAQQVVDALNAVYTKATNT